MSVVENERVQILNNNELCKGNYVLYWMQQSQRVYDNQALTFAIEIANSLNLPVLVFFGLTDNYPEANLRHYSFMLDGLEEVEDDLKKLSIKFLVWLIDPAEGVVNLAQNAAAVIADAGYLKIQRQWRSNAAEAIKCKFFVVESEVIVPVETASVKENYSAGTFRPRIKKELHKYLKKIPDIKPNLSSIDSRLKTIDIKNREQIISDLNIDKTITPVKDVKGGSREARKKLKYFINNSLNEYDEKRNHPGLAFSSGLSPYLHFGQISPITIALEILKHNNSGAESFLEELIVRRELSMNFVYYNNDYDNIRCLPNWALETLKNHELYPRDYLYTLSDYENCKTHDIYWNAAQYELFTTGIMHGYMRMYWGKKIIEWSESPEAAFDFMVFLNNKYALDGRDANSYAGIAWCFGKHDRAWQERPVFGKVRYMNANGLKKKFDMTKYIEKVSFPILDEYSF